MENVATLHQKQPSDPAEDIVEIARSKAKAWLAASPERVQGDIAAGTKASRATINLFLCDKYGGDNKKVAEEVLRFLERDHKTEEAVVAIQPVETKAFTDVQAALDLARTTRKIAIISGDPGTGKTFAAVQFAEQDPRFNLMLYTRYGMGSPKGFFAELWRVLQGAEQTHYGYGERMSGMVLEHLKKKPRFVIVNDAHRCGFEVFAFACDIVEQAGVGIAFIGHSVMRDNIQKLQRKDSQTFDRVEDFSNFTEVSHRFVTEKGQIAPVCSRTEIKAVAKQLLPQITKEAVALLHDVALFPSMRSVVNTCEVARVIKLRVKGNMAEDERLIRKAIKLRRSA